MSQELKPCPFCGATHIAIGYEGQPARHIYVVCNECRAQGPSQDYFSGMTFDMDAAWQRRRPPEQSRGDEARVQRSENVGEILYETLNEAARYRWLRDKADSVDWSERHPSSSWSKVTTSYCRTTPDRMDEIIDAALSRSALGREDGA